MFSATSTIPYWMAPGTLLLTGTSTFTTATTIVSANVILRGGQLATSSLSIQKGGSLTIDETTSTLAPFSTGNSPALNINNAAFVQDAYPSTLSVIANSSANTATTVNFGAVALQNDASNGMGPAVLALTNNNAANGAQLNVNFGTITRSTGATLEIKPIGTDLGSGIAINAAGVATATDISQLGTLPIPAGTDDISFSSTPTPAGPSTTAARPPIPWPRTSPPRPSKPLPSPAPPAAPGTSRSTAPPPPRPWPPPLRRPRCKPPWTA